MRNIKVLIADQNAVDAVHRALYTKLVEQGGIELRLVVPEKLFNNFRVITFEPPAETPKYQLFGVRVLFSSRAHRLVYLGLQEHLKNFRPDVFYMYSEPENFATFHSAMITPPSTKLVFYTARNIDHRRIGYPYKLSFLNRWIERFVLSRAHHGIACTHDAPGLFSSHSFANITVIPLAIETGLFSPREYSKGKGRFVIGYVGRLASQKGVDLLIRSMAQLKSDCVGRFIGDGPEKSSLLNLARTLGVSPQVEFKSSVDRASLPELLSEMDVLVLPSRTTRYWKEQFGRVLIEAMACGVPVVGSDSGEIPYVIADAGIVFREGNVDELAAALQLLHADPSLRARLREKGLQRVHDLYSVERVAAQYAKLFKSLVET